MRWRWLEQQDHDDDSLLLSRMTLELGMLGLLCGTHDASFQVPEAVNTSKPSTYHAYRSILGHDESRLPAITDSRIDSPELEPIAHIAELERRAEELAL